MSELTKLISLVAHFIDVVDFFRTCKYPVAGLIPLGAGVVANALILKFSLAPGIRVRDHWAQVLGALG